MRSDNIVNVSEADFEYEVLAYSQETPVVVDFWAEWCGPCKMLGPLLEKLAQEADGGFRLAKVNVDDNPNLAKRYNIRGIPAVKAFNDGRLVAEFTGMQPEPRVREFLKSLAPSQGDLLEEKAFSLLAAGDLAGAEQSFRQALESDSVTPQLLLGLSRTLLLQGQAQEARYLLRDFPASKEYNAAQAMLPVAEGLIAAESFDPFESENPLDAAYYQAMRLVRLGNPDAALDGLLDILRQDKRYSNGKARLAVLGLLEMLGSENPSAQSYRNELASVLF